jgi:hypothetical protein
MTLRAWFATGALSLVLFGCTEDQVSFVDSGILEDAAIVVDRGPTPDAYVNPCAPNPAPTIEGTVYAPNGVDPVAGASIGVPIGLDPLPSSVRCMTCAVVGRFVRQTYSNADGSFEFEGVPNDGKPFLLSIQKGYFRRVIEVTVDKCGRLELDKESTRLPGKNGQYHPQDTVPKIAVITGVWDKLERVLDKLGVEQKDVYNGRDLGTGPESVQALFQNAALLKSYHMVFINCGTRFESLVTDIGPPRLNLRSYVREGGRLFATDYSYDYIEQVFPEFIDFQGSTQGDWSMPEEHDAAEVGKQDLVIEADIRDNELKKWLGLPEIGALLPNGKLQVLGLQTAWAVQFAVNPNGKIWASGKVTGVGVDPNRDRPLTSSFEFVDDDKKGCGRLVFSSYHTHGNAPVLLPQERVLEYLMLEIGGCPRVQ